VSTITTELPKSVEISDSDCESYEKDGFLVVPNALTGEEVEELRHETVEICRGHRGAVNGLAESSEDEPDDEIIRRTLCIHQIHKISPIMLHYLAQSAMVEGLTKLIGPNVKCMQSMLFIKAAGKPGQAWHQDEIFIPTRDRSLTGGWVAMDDATTENGCLWVIPGSHSRGILWPQENQNDPRFDCAAETRGFPYQDEDAIPVEVKAGAIVFFNGYLLHRSLPNRAAGGYRRALVNHYMSAESLLPWRTNTSADTPVQVGRSDFRDIVMIAGEDPYAFKGLEDTVRPSVRRSGEGGCGEPKRPKSK